MSLHILIDMSLSPDWQRELEIHGWAAVHWSEVGNPRAPDREIMDWARAHKHVVFTNDLDFGTLLALTRAQGPSVMQVRASDVLPSGIGSLVVAAVKQHELHLASGALVVIDETRSRVRVLPIQ